MTGNRAPSIQIVLATQRQGDRDALAILLEGSAWDLVHVATAQEATAALRRVKFPILLCDSSIGGEKWELRGLSSARRGTYVILLTDAGEAMHFPDFDCITRPLQREQVFRALFFAYARSRIRWPVGVLARPRNSRVRILEQVEAEQTAKEQAT